MTVGLLALGMVYLLDIGVPLYASLPILSFGPVDRLLHYAATINGEWRLLKRLRTVLNPCVG